MEHGRAIRQFIDVPMLGQEYIKNYSLVLSSDLNPMIHDSIEE